MKSAYIHIPFCDTICSYCDFCKFLKNDEWINKYLDSLEIEIKSNYKKETLDTIYIGGGTPSCLNINQLNKLFNIIKIFNKSNDIEFTFECNIENITKDKLKILYDNGVNRLSIGIQTFNKKHLSFLNRNHTKNDIVEKINLAKEIGFKNINIDLIYALPNQTLEELNEDIDEFLKLDITHISTYSLIIEPNTKVFINNYKNIDDSLDYEMYKLICDKLKCNGYNHYEISNFSKDGYESKHNLTYWNNNEYYGFGLGASGYIDNVRYDNTRNFNKYLNGEYVKESHELDIKETIENEFILGLRKINGISKEIFKKKYNKNIKDIELVNKLLKENKLLEDEKNIYINPDYIYVSNDILIEFIN
ncbi:MAG: radical SAM family heme chaperone HemW [Bacilli bacterium]|nr:radical SAM family heme chaperone HemW [Bacilli bacterium]